MIPTNETASMTFISRLLVSNKIHSLIHGPETSKTLVAKILKENIFDNSYICKNLPLANCSITKNVLNTLIN